MTRLEIIANHSVEENILEALGKEGVGKYYTKYPTIFGVGSSGPRMGDSIWPEENFALVIWCEEEEARTIKRAVEGVKERFPDEGVKIFGLAEPKAESEATSDSAPAAAPKTEAKPEAAAVEEEDLAGYFVLGVEDDG
jgi:hypothetical protein